MRYDTQTVLGIYRNDSAISIMRPAYSRPYETLHLIPLQKRCVKTWHGFCFVVTPSISASERFLEGNASEWRLPGYSCLNHHISS